MMTSIKVKFRPSTVDGKEGGLYFQIIHNRVVRQLNTDYKVFAEEWDAEAESIIVNGNRSNLQPPNARSPMDVTLLGIITLVRFTHS